MMISRYVDLEPPKKWLTISFDVVYVSTNILLGISCFTVIRNVFRIRMYLIKQGAKDFIDTAVLLRHALVFGLVFVFVIAQTITFFIQLWAPTIFTYAIFQVTSFVMTLAISVSDLLLANLFWIIGKRPSAD